MIYVNNLVEFINQEFKDYVLSSPLYDAILYEDIGDGIMVIKLK